MPTYMCMYISTLFGNKEEGNRENIHICLLLAKGNAGYAFLTGIPLK